MKHAVVGVNLVFCVLFFFVKDVALLPLDYHELTEKHSADLKEAFALLDKNRDGKITVDELSTVIRNVMKDKITDSELQEMVALADLDGNGKIELNEFLNMMGNAADLKDAFIIMDENGDGFISASELRNAMISLGENVSLDEAKDMIRDADRNGDKKLNYGEFVRQFKKMFSTS